MPNETKPPLPWFQIECEVRAGLIPVNKIAKKYGCSHTAIYKHCKKYKIRRDLRKPIRDAVVRESAKEIVTLGRRGSYKSTKDTAELVANAHKPDEQQKLVDAVAIEIQQLLASHREGIRRLRELEFKLIERIYGDPKKEWVGQFKGEIITHQQDIPATELAQAASALANVQTKRGSSWSVKRLASSMRSLTTTRNTESMSSTTEAPRAMATNPEQGSLNRWQLTAECGSQTLIHGSATFTAIIIRAGRREDMS